MSDAIRLIVGDESPIRLAVGEADPVARREIAELQEDVAAIQEDVSGLQEDVADIEEQLDGFALTDGTYPALTSGASLSLTSPTAAESTWAQRVTDAVDGVAVVDGILGQTVVWNQGGRFVKWSGEAPKWGSGFNPWSISADGRSASIENGAGTNIIYWSGIPTGHKLCFSICITASGTFDRWVEIGFGGTYVSSGVTLQPNTKTRIAMVGTMGTTNKSVSIYPNGTSSSVTCDYTLEDFQLFDLTSMFGAGNEPSTVAEFERMFPEPYYPYDAGSLLSVQMEGIETVGFNQWDEVWELGEYAGDGSKRARSNAIRSAGFIPCLPSTEYRWTCASHSSSHGVLNFYDADKTFISRLVGALNYTVTPPANARYMTFYIAPETTYNNDICINISDPALNGTYKPYATYQRTIPAATYFPNGMRSAGTVHDELTSDAAITRVRAVDLGTLTWSYRSENSVFYAAVAGMTSGNAAEIKISVDVPYTVTHAYNLSSTAVADLTICEQVGVGRVIIRDDSFSGDTTAFAAAMSGKTLFYALATPATQPIDPPLTMTYRVEHGGTESVMHTDQTAVPTWRVRYPFDLAATVMANIAPVEQAVATATHAIGDLLCVGWQLYRVTRAIATGERITAGTNVTATTVAAEIAAIQ